MGSRPRREADEGVMQHSDLNAVSEPSDLHNIVPFLEETIAQDVDLLASLLVKVLRWRLDLHVRFQRFRDCNFKLDTKPIFSLWEISFARPSTVNLGYDMVAVFLYRT
jgi:hypothetical protein